jgi:hypothetical protein
MKYAIQMGSGAMINVPRLVQPFKSLGDTHKYTDTHTAW